MSRFKNIRKGLFISLAGLMVVSSGAGLTNINANAKRRHVHVSRVAKRHARKHVSSIRSINHKIRKTYSMIHLAKRHHRSTKRLYRYIRSLRHQRSAISARQFENSHKEAYWFYRHGAKMSHYMPNTNRMYRKAYDDVNSNNTLEPKYTRNKDYQRGWIITFAQANNLNQDNSDSSNSLNNVMSSSNTSGSSHDQIANYSDVIDLYNQGLVYARNHNNVNINVNDEIWSTDQSNNM